MNLYILRHGIAVEHGTGGYKDSERPLTSEGEKKLLQIGKALKALDLSLDLILSSPYTRARQTAESVAASLKCEKVLEFSDHLASDGDSKALIQDLNARSPASAMLVGHEPDLSRLISLLLAGRTGLSLDLKKGGLCKLNIESLQHGRCATLDWLLAPKVVLGLIE